MGTTFPHWEFVSDLEKLIAKVRSVSELRALRSPRPYAYEENLKRMESEEASAIDAFSQKWGPKE